MKRRIEILILLALTGFLGGCRILSSNELDVTLSSQQNCFWCWTASIQMIVNYHQPSDPLTQSEIATKYCGLIPFEYDPENPDDTGVGCDSTDCNSNSCQISLNNNCLDTYSCISNEENSCNIPIDTENDDITNLLSILGYAGTKNEVPLSWEKITSEIDLCHPFLVVLSDNSGNPHETSQHVVVVYGYIATTDFKFVLVKDPWRPCEGCEYALSYDIFENSPSDRTLSVLTTITDIEPTTLTPATICPAPHYENGFSFLGKNKANTYSEAIDLGNYFFGHISKQSAHSQRTILGSSDYFFKRKDYKTIPLKYLSYSQVLKNSSNFSLERVTTNNEVIVMYSPETPSTFIILEKVNNYWTISSVEQCSYLCCQSNGLSINCQSFFTAKLPNNITLNLIPSQIRSLVKFPTLNMEFLYFDYKGKTYCTPTKNYVDLIIKNKPLEKGMAYEESLFMEMLYRSTILYEHNFKKRHLKKDKIYSR